MYELDQKLKLNLGNKQYSKSQKLMHILAFGISMAKFSLKDLFIITVHTDS